MISLVMAALVAATGQWSCDDEDARVTQHLEDALIQLRAVTPPGLSEAQRTRRAQVLEGLARYVDEKQFPRSSGAVGPVFVDREDHHCAMGALLAWNGGRQIVEHIRSTRNLETVPVLADEPGLAQWLDEHGMTAEEAALVQPTYFVCIPPVDICWGRAFPQTWYTSGTHSLDGGAPLEMRRVASPDGQCAGPALFTPGRELPSGTLVSSRELAIAGDQFIHASWAQCRNPVLISPSALAQPTAAGCMREMIAADPRALLPVCARIFGGGYQVRRCADDGRYFAANLPDAGVEAAVREYFSRYVEFDLDDAGISLAAAAAVEADAWAHSDDGGSVPAGDFAQLLSWNGTNADTCVILGDGGVENRVDAGTTADAGTAADAGAPHDAGAPVEPVPPVDAGEDVPPVRQQQGCSTGLGCAMGLVILLLRRSLGKGRRACSN